MSKNRKYSEVTDDTIENLIEPEAEDVDEQTSGSDDLEHAEEGYTLNLVPYTVIADELLNIRAEPSLDSKVVGMVGRGVKLKSDEDPSEINGFIPVVGEMVSGYAMSKYLRKD